MKKKLLLIVGAVLALGLAAFIALNAGTRSITVVSGKDLVDKCPRRARPGEEVTVTTAVVCDGEIYVNGADGRYVQPGVYVFTMPDEDVQLKVHITAYPNGA